MLDLNILRAEIEMAIKSEETVKSSLPGIDEIWEGASKRMKNGKKICISIFYIGEKYKKLEKEIPSSMLIGGINCKIAQLSSDNYDESLEFVPMSTFDEKD
jgi:hypothetical protein